MKKIILAIAAVVLSAGIMSAQDMSSATTTYNNGAEALQLGDKATALKNFQEALTMGEACGDEGAELVANCKKAIANTILSQAKDLVNAKNFKEASAKLEEAAKVAESYGVAEVAEEAKGLIPTVGIQEAMSEANDALKANDAATALAGYKKVLTLDPTNGNAALRIVQVLAGAGKLDEAKEAVATAEANGQGENAKKILGGAYLKSAAADLKAGKSADAVAKAVASTEYSENPQAYLIAGQASQKANKTADAITYFSKYLDAAPTAKNAGQIALTVGALYQGQQNKAKAIEYYKKAQAAGVPDCQKYIDALSK